MIRCLAADCPINLLFKPSRLPLPATLWRKLLKEFPAISEVLRQLDCRLLTVAITSNHQVVLENLESFPRNHVNR